MKLNKEQQKIMDGIFDMLGVSNQAMKFGIFLPHGFLEKVQNHTLDDPKLTDYLNKVSIELSASEYSLKNSKTNTIYVLFDTRKTINREKNKMTINYKHAPTFISMIINSTQPFVFTVETKKRSHLKYLRYIGE